MDLTEEELKAINKIIAPDKKTANEMFEELEYEKIRDDQNFILYKLCCSYIGFDLINKTIELSYDDDGEDTSEYMTIEELQAINKKVEELGWKD